MSRSSFRLSPPRKHLAKRAHDELAMSQQMTPEQQKEMQAAQEAYAKATPEQKKAIQAAAMAQMTPEQKAQVGPVLTCRARVPQPCQSRAAYRPPAHRTHLRRRAVCLGRLLEAVLTCRLVTPRRRRRSEACRT